MNNIKNNILVQKGFTLMEVLIAITVLSVMMLIVINMTEDSANTADRVITEDRELLQLETAFSRFQWDFNHLYSPLYFEQVIEAKFLNEQQQEAFNKLITSYDSNRRFPLVSFNYLPIPKFEHEDKHDLVFLTAGHRRKFENAPQSNYAWVKYSLESDEKENKWVRKTVVQDVFSRDSIDWDDAKGQVLARKIRKLVFKFWNPETRKWVENMDVVKNGQHVIHGLKVTINYLDYADIELVTERIFRPLFPYFVPENMYDYLNPEQEKKTQNDNQ